jgi:hypothetical protein
MVLSAVSRGYSILSGRFPRVTHPCATLLMTEVTFTFDLHVLSLPPAFVLSQDQTLMLYKNRILLCCSKQFFRNHAHIIFGSKPQCGLTYIPNMTRVQKLTCVFLVLMICAIMWPSHLYMHLPSVPKHFTISINIGYSPNRCASFRFAFHRCGIGYIPKNLGIVNIKNHVFCIFFIVCCFIWLFTNLAILPVWYFVLFCPLS